MQIVANWTRMLAAMTVTADSDRRDYCVVVVKGTFLIDHAGAMRLAPEQAPFIHADEHHGAAETSSIRHESDFALHKPLTDVLIVGKAVAPGGRPVKQMVVTLDVQGRRKELLVTGDRQWTSTLVGLLPGKARPFVEMPLLFERAFGGVDDSQGPGRIAAEPRNLVGVGFQPHRKRDDIVGGLLPNIERPGQPVVGPRDRPDPIGVGCTGRSWAPRSRHAGTYDQRWLDNVCPFLPADFDHRYFQSAPQDQQFEHFRDDETIHCVHMAEAPRVTYKLPAISVPVRFRFRDRDVQEVGKLDTVILEPHHGQAMLVWRARVALGKKIESLREITVGHPPVSAGASVGQRRGKPVFRGIEATLRWLKGRRP